MPFFRSLTLMRVLLPMALGGVFLYGTIGTGKTEEYVAQKPGESVASTSVASTSVPVIVRAPEVQPDATDTPLVGEHLEVPSASVSDTPEIRLFPRTNKETPEEASVVVTHIPTPEPVKAAYMTACIASGPKLRAHLVDLVDTTELNALVIDIKDFTGMVSIQTGDPRFVVNTHGCSIPDIKSFLASLHERNIYVIGRVTVMQDQVFTKTHPDAAVKRRSDGGAWKDRKGLMFVDPGATEYWDYMVDLAKASYDVGFDEINFDYIRYPSDGNMSDVKFTRTGTTTKPEMMRRFNEYIGTHMRAERIPSSADLFGMTTTNTDDLNIGQVLEHALPYFDYVAPMVYPSHYPPGFNGWKNPNMVPYEIIKYSMDRAVARAKAMSSTTPSVNPLQLRPWIQDFNYGKVYTQADIRAQKKAVYDSGLTSWMTWDPKNVYTTAGYTPE